MSQKLFLCILTILVVAMAPAAFAGKTELTTYYPSPYGEYTNLTVTGNVGIGTTSPSLGKLQVDGGSAAVKLAVNTTNAGVGVATLRLQNSAGAFNDVSEITHGGGVLQFRNGTPTTVMTLDMSNARVGIGTTSPSYQLHVSTDSAGKPTTNVWTIASDARIKKNVADFKDGLDMVMKLRPRTYQYNGLGGKGYDDPDTHIGFVAQEIESITPYMVQTRKGKIGGKEVDDFKEYQGHALPYILVNAIQEQQKEIDLLKKEIAELKKR